MLDQNQLLGILNQTDGNQTDDIPNQTDEIPNQTDEIPNQTDDIPNQTDDIPNQTDEIPYHTDEMPYQTDEIEVSSRNKPLFEAGGTLFSGLEGADTLGTYCTLGQGGDRPEPLLGAEPVARADNTLGIQEPESSGESDQVS